MRAIVAGRRLPVLTAAATVMVLATPSGAAAHVKWFCAAADVTQAPAPLSEVITPVFLACGAAFVALAFAVYLVDGAVARVWPAMAKTGPRLAAAEEIVVRVVVALYFLSLWGDLVAAPWTEGGALLTAETVPRSAAWGALQLAVAALVLRRETCALAAAGIFALWCKGVAVHGLFHMTDYMFFPGLAAYLAATSLGSPRLLRLRVPVLIGSLAFSLMWTAIEKFLYPHWTQLVLLEHPSLAFGFDWQIVLPAAGFIEFSFGFYLATGRGLLRVGAVMIAAVFLSAIPEFGQVDLFGHLPIVGILVVAWLRGASPLQDALTPRGGAAVAAVGRAALYPTAFAAFVAAYYALQKTVELF